MPRRPSWGSWHTSTCGTGGCPRARCTRWPRAAAKRRRGTSSPGQRPTSTSTAGPPSGLSRPAGSSIRATDTREPPPHRVLSVIWVFLSFVCLLFIYLGWDRFVCLFVCFCAKLTENEALTPTPTPWSRAPPPPSYPQSGFCLANVLQCLRALAWRGCACPASPGPPAPSLPTPPSPPPLQPPQGQRRITTPMTPHPPHAPSSGLSLCSEDAAPPQPSFPFLLPQEGQTLCVSPPLPSTTAIAPGCRQERAQPLAPPLTQVRPPPPPAAPSPPPRAVAGDKTAFLPPGSLSDC